MRLAGTSLALVVAALPAGVLSQVITITQYPSTCRAIYTAGSSSVTVVQSTLAVSPTPLTDASLNAGAPFVVQIQPGSGSRKRQEGEATYLAASGYTTTDASRAAQYRISNGTLVSTAGQWVSTNVGVENMPFALSSTVGSIVNKFYSQDLDLHWDNDAFDGGSAGFFTAPAGNGSQQVIVRFSGPVDARWTSVTFAARSTGGLALEPSTPAASTSITTIISMGSMTVPYTSPTSQPSSNVNPNGICGGTSGFNCFGAPSGSCCSSYGYCGKGPDYCDAGCQAGFGDCSLASTSQTSSAAPTTPTGGSLVWSSNAATSSPPGPSVTVSKAEVSSSGQLSTLPVLSSAISPILSTSLSVSVLGSSSITYSVTFTSTPSSSWANLPTYSEPGQPIGPVGPVSSSQGPSSGYSSPVIASSATPAISSPQSGSSTVIPPAYASSMTSPAIVSIANSLSSPISSISSLQSPISSSTPASTSSFPAIIPVQTPSSSRQASSTSLVSGSPVGYGSSRSPSIATSSSPASPTPSALCPAADNTVVTDSQGTQYQIRCGADTNGDLLSTTQTTTSVTECMVACDLAAGCLGFTWIGTGGAINGRGPGNCYLKGPDGPEQFDTSGEVSASRVAAIRLNPPGQSASSVRSTPGSAPAYGQSTSSIRSMPSSAPAYGQSTPSVNSTPGSAPAYGQSSSSARSTPNSAPSYGQSSLSTRSTSNSAPAYGQSSSSASSIPLSAPAYGPSSSAILSSTASLFSSSSSTRVAQSSSAIPPAYSSPAVASSFRSTAVSSSPATSSPNGAPAYSVPQPTTSSPAQLSSTRVASSRTSTSSSTSNYLVIPSPTPCSFGDPPTYDEDDSYCEVDLPQPMTLYSLSDTKTYPSTNGYISLTAGSSQYEAQQFPDEFLPAGTIAPLFDDWFIYGNTSPTQGIFYSLDPAGVWYEYYLSRAGQTANTMHFTVRYEYAKPGVFTYRYYDLSGENGEFASVGMQGVDTNGSAQGFTYSFQMGDISPGLVVRCDSNANVCTTVV